MTVTLNELRGKAEDYTGPRENEVREPIPVPFDNNIQRIFRSRATLEGYF